MSDRDPRAPDNPGPPRYIIEWPPELPAAARILHQALQQLTRRGERQAMPGDRAVIRLSDLHQLVDGAQMLDERLAAVYTNLVNSLPVEARAEFMDKEWYGGHGELGEGVGIGNREMRGALAQGQGGQSQAALPRGGPFQGGQAHVALSRGGLSQGAQSQGQVRQLQAALPRTPPAQILQSQGTQYQPRQSQPAPFRGGQPQGAQSQGAASKGGPTQAVLTLAQARQMPGDQLRGSPSYCVQDQDSSGGLSGSSYYRGQLQNQPPGQLQDQPPHLRAPQYAQPEGGQLQSTHFRGSQVQTASTHSGKAQGVQPLGSPFQYVPSQSRVGPLQAALAQEDQMHTIKSKGLGGSSQGGHSSGGQSSGSQLQDGQLEDNQAQHAQDKDSVTKFLEGEARMQEKMAELAKLFNRPVRVHPDRFKKYRPDLPTFSNPPPGWVWPKVPKTSPREWMATPIGRLSIAQFLRVPGTFWAQFPGVKASPHPEIMFKDAKTSLDSPRAVLAETAASKMPKAIDWSSLLGSSLLTGDDKDRVLPLPVPSVEVENPVALPKLTGVELAEQRRTASRPMLPSISNLLSSTPAPARRVYSLPEVSRASGIQPGSEKKRVFTDASITDAAAREVKKAKLGFESNGDETMQPVKKVVPNRRPLALGRAAAPSPEAPSAIAPARKLTSRKITDKSLSIAKRKSTGAGDKDKGSKVTPKKKTDKSSSVSFSKSKEKVENDAKDKTPKPSPDRSADENDEDDENEATDGGDESGEMS